MVMKRFYLLFMLSVLGTWALAQNTVTGTVTDESTGEALIGASVFVKGTSTGTVTDWDGSFTLQDVPSGSQSISISYVGYETTTRTVNVSGNTDLGTVGISSSAVGLGEVVVTGVMDIVQDRRTPVAVSTITTAEIQAQSGNVEFPELMKSTPSIYVANQAGGYGDSEVFTRGFDQTNTAFLLNGQPINGMEDGKMYWSNWSGMADVANAIQVQRGLGSSKLAISSVGGTTNIIMKATDIDQGGSVRFLYGNDNYMKATASYSTGMKGKWGATMLFTHWQGNGWAEGTKGTGQNYFLSVGYKANEHHSVNFLITGAPQWHDQNYTKRISDYYQGTDELNPKFNNNYGYINGNYMSVRRNYYHKPVANLNWEWSINDKSNLATVLYGSWGRGGGSGGIGSWGNYATTSDGYVDFDQILKNNFDADGSSEWVLRNSVNNHAWYGLVTNYNTKITDEVSFNIGGDLRTYHGSHFREVRDLLEAPAYSQRANARFGDREITQTYKADPWSALSSYAGLENQIGYSNDETISYAGVFGQLEYNTDKVSAFVQSAVSNQSHVRYELFNEPASNEESEKVNNVGFNVKTGASYSFDRSNTIFFNTGFYQRQPFHDNIYLNYSNDVNPVTVPEKIFGLEAGYKLQLDDLALNLNVYRTSWKDRTRTRTLDAGTVLPNGDSLVADGYRNTLQDQLHSGVELDFSYRVLQNLRIKGYTSIGNWIYEGDIQSTYFNDNRDVILEQKDLDVDGVKVGGAAQTTFGVGADWTIIDDLKMDIDYNYYSNLHSNISAGTSTLKLPSFGLLDLGLSYRFDLGNKQMLSFRTNLYNVTNKLYISRAYDAVEASSVDSENWEGVNKDNRVTFGKQLTWNISARYNF